MMKKRAGKTLLFVIKQMQDQYYQGVAAELGFFFLMSMVPLFILLGQVLGLFSISLDVLQEILTEYVSPELAENLKGYVSYNAAGSFNIVFIVVAVWAASRAQYAMIQLANYAYTGKAFGGRAFIKERLRSMKLVLLTIILIAFSLVILIYGEALIKMLGFYVQQNTQLSFRFNNIWYILRWPAGFALYIFVVSYIYYQLPYQKQPFKKVLPGSIAASVGMLIATWAYSYYIGNFANYDLLYGSLAAIVILMFWFYILGHVLLFGIVFNVAWDKAGG